MLETLWVGARLGLAFNPLVSVLAAPAVAALSARSPREHSLLGVPGLLLLAAWFAGDGLAASRVAAEVLGSGPGPSGAASGPAALSAVVLWMLVGSAVGYAAPAWAGAFVGRRVTHGSGWASAAVTALTASVTLSAMTGAVLT
ncbi:MAG: hypothetical protein IBX62_10020 [Coriobacteriia bacterium]|nr:hypothetical protein [Coriobacteriia bacterium]